MFQYRPPIEDTLFVMDQVIGAPEQWARIPEFQEVDISLVSEILNYAGRFSAEVVEPMNSTGDLEGCQWSAETGEVRTPRGYIDAWQQFVDGGWPALCCESEDGGQGLPQLINAAVFEMVGGCNDSWTMYSGVLHGAYESLRHYGSASLRERYMEKIVSGECLATMCLTEAHAGSDLALLSSKAVPVASGTLQNGDEVTIDAHKIFISGGEQDITENIIHLVLARLPDAPQGTKGLSLFLVPKLLPDGQRNNVYCDGIEKKMGLKGSATCQMRFEKAKGWLVGEPHSGLKAMFLMMNAARIHVGVKSIGHLESACQLAHQYAFERKQSSAPKQPESENNPSPHIIALHGAIRHKLWRLTAQTQAARVLAFWAVSLLDEQNKGTDKNTQQACADLVALLTPIVKGFITDTAYFGCDDALGLFGGYGYIHDYGIEQHVRDSRVARLYEGSNEIQAIDLVTRKLLGKRSGLPYLFDELERVANACQLASEKQSGDFSSLLSMASRCVLNERRYIDAAVTSIRRAAAQDIEAPFLVADEMLNAMGHAMFTWAWAKIALATESLAESEFRTKQRTLSQYGLEWLSAHSKSRFDGVMAQRCLPWATKMD